MDDKYQCHICMEIANKPVVTPCGHLFCWACIYHWLRSNQEYLTCPICKSGLEMSSLRPIIDPNAPIEKAQNGIPPRPRPFKKPKIGSVKKQIPKSIANIGMNVQRGVLLAGYGIFPSMYMGINHQHRAPQQNQSPFESQGGREWMLYKLMGKVNYFFFILLILIIIFFI